ncbi:MAG: TonB-dependent receptor [Burkholderiales bacterium]|jgi:outer membrane receptor protein involved in Fe transport|nr:TonB-dependent receptor [Burkholderiales bacterium]
MHIKNGGYLAFLCGLGGYIPLSHAQTTLPSVVIKAKPTITTATRLDEDPLHLPFMSYGSSRSQIDEHSSGSLEEIMRAVPGLQHGTQGNYFTRFETRGLRDTQDVLVLVDGVPLRLLQGNADVALIPLDLIHRFEFIKGPSSALYGKNAVGGVVQYFLKPDATGGKVNLTLDTFGRRDISIQNRWDTANGQVYLGAAHSHTDGFQKNTSRYQPSLVLGGDYLVNTDWNTGFQLFTTRVKAYRGSIVPLENGMPMYGIQPEDNFAIPGVSIEGEYQSISWKNRLRLSPTWRLEHLTSYTYYDRFFQGGITIVPGPTAVNKGYSETDTADRGLFHDVMLNHDYVGRGWRNSFQLGVNWDQAWQNQASPTFSNAPTYRGPNYNTPVTNISNDPRGIRGQVTRSRFDQRVQSFYLQNRWENEKLGLSLGLRHDRFEQSLSRSNTSTVSAQSASRTSPRLGIDWRWSAEHAAFIHYAEGFRPQAVALNTRNNVIVPDILRPEVTRSFEFGFKGRADNNYWSYQISLFQANKIDGQRSFRNGPDSFIFTNATSRTQGIETWWQWRLNTQWRGYLHYTYQDVRLRDFQTFDNAGNPIANYAGNRVRMSARHIAGLGVTYEQAAWLWSSSLQYVGSRPLRDNRFNSQVLPAYTLLNTSLTYRWNTKWSVQAGINNALDEYYINDDFSAQEAGNAGAPRHFFLRLQHTF